MTLLPDTTTELSQQDRDRIVRNQERIRRMEIEHRREIEERDEEE